MVRLRDYARALGVCKKTALMRARRDGLTLEKRPVRGGWAWFVIDVKLKARGRDEISVERLAWCIAAAQEACKRGMPMDRQAEMAAALYREMS